MQRFYKAIGHIVLMLGGVLVGAMIAVTPGMPQYLGANLSVGPFVWISGGIGGILALLACFCAMEWSEAQARNKQIRKAIEHRFTQLREYDLLLVLRTRM